ncbi:MAG: hypothetical protein KC900_04220 [Candidatus Omnitrophica bacterium]|nr:hypothetical protein [Candidatus Omnitrophota bacterium]
MRHNLMTLGLIIFVAGAAENAAAQADWSPPAGKSLAISLNGLKQSAAQMKLRNAWLQSEIQVLEMKIEQAGSPDRPVQRPQATGTYQPVAAAQQPTAVQAPPVPGPEAVALSKEDRLLKEIALVQQDIRDMTSALQAMPEIKADVASTVPQHEARLRSAEENIKVLRRQLEEVADRHSDSLGEYNALQTKNLELKERRADLLAQLQQGEAEHGRLSDELKTLDERIETHIKTERQQVAELEEQQQRLESVLRKADLRIDGKRNKLVISDQEIETLMENRHFIQAENTSLKDQYSRLQEDWKEMTKSSKK